MLGLSLREDNVRMGLARLEVHYSSRSAEVLVAAEGRLAGSRRIRPVVEGRCNRMKLEGDRTLAAVGTWRPQGGIRSRDGL